jgi:hypothetical protein
MLRVPIKLIMLTVIMLSVMMSVGMISVSMISVSMISVFMLSVGMLTVWEPLKPVKGQIIIELNVFRTNTSNFIRPKTHHSQKHFKGLYHKLFF